MNETPERICEALEWLTGHKWADNGMLRGKPSFFCADGDQSFEWDSEDGYCLHRGWFKRNIEDELAHALEVTAPWEWKNFRNSHTKEAKGSDFIACAGSADYYSDVFCYSINTKDVRISDAGYKDLEQAQTAARAAYLCWMRGRFAMKGDVA